MSLQRIQQYSLLRLFITAPNSLSLQHNVFSFPVEYEALTQLWGGTMPETVGYNGKYLIPWARMGEPRADTQDLKTGVNLWEWYEEQVGDI